MKKLVLVVVLLQLCLSVLEVNAGGGGAAVGAGGAAAVNQPEFGDLIEFPRGGVYSHYGIYVGREPFSPNINKAEDQNIFEMTMGGCQFTHEAGPFIVRNNYYTETPQNRAGMKATIEALLNDPDRCKNYSLRKENCEMVATMVRYGRAMCKQTGTAAEGAAKHLNPRKKRQKNKQKHHEAPAAA